MKIAVHYTEEYSPEDLAALSAFCGESVGRDDIRQLLHDLGTMGVEEQIAVGRKRLSDWRGKGR